MIPRVLKKHIEKRLFHNKVIIVIGARQVGKTTLIREILKKKTVLFLNGNEGIVRSRLSEPNKTELKSIIGDYKIVFIDEAQRIDKIGLTAKIIHDQFKDVQLILTGSSAFELKNQTNEPLTGRKWQFYLFPISYQELEQSTNYIDALKDLENRLIYGSYPDVLNYRGEEREILNEITESYLFKDILAFGNIRKPQVLEKILRALAFQVGSEVNYNEIAQLVGVDRNTVVHYVHLLKLAYVIYPLPAFSRNLRNEIKKGQKIYFYDNGIRNALIHNFNPLDLRADTGALWENFLVSERLKRNCYFKHYTKAYFWRTKQQQEIDYIEEADGKIMGYEFKWNPKAKTKIPKTFVRKYDTEVKRIDRDNFRDFIID